MFNDLVFEWDPIKAQINEKKHGVSFDDATTVFFDGFAFLIPDPDHSENEDRFLLLGRTWTWQILVVSHTYRDFNSAIRIISARKANAMEKTKYGVSK